MKQDGLSPIEVTFGTLIKGYARVNNLNKMMEKYEQMQSLGIKANQTVFTMIMDAYGKNKDFDSAVIWFKEMGSSGLSPDKKAKNIFLSLAKSKEELKEANMLVGDMDQRDGAPQLDGNLRFVRTEVSDEEDGDDDYEDNYGSNDVEKAIYTAVEQDDAMTFNAIGMSCEH